MTTRPILVVDPVTGAAVASDLTRLFSVGVLDLTCPTCGGSGVLPYGPDGTSAGCYDCPGDGQVTLPTDILVADHHHILGTLHGVQALPIVRDCDDLPDVPALIEIVDDGLLRYWPEGATDEHESEDVSDALPWGSWTPGATAIRFGRFEASVPCPTCGGIGDTQAGRIVMRGGCGKCHGFGQKRCPISWPGAPATPGLHHIDLTEAVA